MTWFFVPVVCTANTWRRQLRSIYRSKQKCSLVARSCGETSRNLVNILLHRHVQYLVGRFEPLSPSFVPSSQFATEGWPAQRGKGGRHTRKDIITIVIVLFPSVAIFEGGKSSEKFICISCRAPKHSSDSKQKAICSQASVLFFRGRLEVVHLILPT